MLQYSTRVGCPARTAAALSRLTPSAGRVTSANGITTSTTAAVGGDVASSASELAEATDVARTGEPRSALVALERAGADPDRLADHALAQDRLADDAALVDAADAVDHAPAGNGAPTGTGCGRAGLLTEQTGHLAERLHLVLGDVHLRELVLQLGDTHLEGLLGFLLLVGHGDPLRSCGGAHRSGCSLSSPDAAEGTTTSVER